MAAVGLTGSNLYPTGAQDRKSASTATARKPSAIGFTAVRCTTRSSGKSQNFRHDQGSERMTTTEIKAELNRARDAEQAYRLARDKAGAYEQLLTCGNYIKYGMMRLI